MRRQSVVSSNIVSAGYDAPTQTLEVEFHTGRVYQYYNVPTAIYEAFTKATSKGGFLAAQIRDRYPYARV